MSRNKEKNTCKMYKKHIQDDLIVCREVFACFLNEDMVKNPANVCVIY